MKLYIKHRGKLGGTRSRKHANAATREHKEDQVIQELRRRESEGLEKLESDRLDLASALGIEFEQLDLAPLSWDRTGQLIDGSTFDRILADAKVGRRRYLARRSDRPGKARWVEITSPVEHYSVPLSPWATKTLNIASRLGYNLPPLLSRLGTTATRAWEAATGFEVLVMPLHPKPSLDSAGLPKTTHFQPYFSKVSETGDLLGERRGKGKSSKLRFAGPVLLACVRLRSIGLNPDEFGFPGAAVRLNFLLKDRQSGGQKCADLLTQQAVDEEFFSILLEHPTLAKIEEECRSEYLLWKRTQILNKPFLIKENSTLRLSVERLTAENEALRRKNAILEGPASKANALFIELRGRFREVISLEEKMRFHFRPAPDGRFEVSGEMQFLMDMILKIGRPDDACVAEVRKFMATKLVAEDVVLNQATVDVPMKSEPSDSRNHNK